MDGRPDGTPASSQRDAVLLCNQHNQPHVPYRQASAAKLPSRIGDVLHDFPAFLTAPMTGTRSGRPTSRWSPMSPPKRRSWLLGEDRGHGPLSPAASLTATCISLQTPLGCSSWPIGSLAGDPRAGVRADSGRRAV